MRLPERLIAKTGGFASGFTLIEIILVLGILIILAQAVVPSLGLNTTAQLNESTSQIVVALRTARERSVARVNNSAHGIFFTINTSGADSMTLYQGTSYATRNATYDQITTFDAALGVTTTLSGNEINFSRSLGVPSNVGNISISHQSTNSTRIIQINSYGRIQDN